VSEDEDPLTLLCRERVGAMLSAKWRLDALIGVGGMAAVYASSHRNGARAAIKVLHAEYAGHAEVRARFLREAYIANKVEHSGTVKVLDDDVSEKGEPYLVMELLVGESVESRARRNGGWLRYPEVLTIVDQALAVLEKAHAAGVVHRDLKPDNLFFSTKGEVKVLDFGIARLQDSAATKRTQTGMMMGTPSYMAPEQAMGKWSEVDGRTDLWAVGAIFYSLLSGRIVHDAKTDNEVFIRAATRPAPSLARVVPNAPADVVRVVDRALQFEPRSRYQDAASMRVAVRALMAAANVPAWGGDATAPVATSPTTQIALPGAGPAGALKAGTAAAVAPPPAAVVPGSTFVAPPLQSPVAPEVQAPPLVPTHVATSRVVPESRVEGAPSPAPPPPSFAPLPPSFAPPARAPSFRPPAPPLARTNVEDDAYAADYATDEELQTMKELFTEMERALIAKNQYGAAHPEARRRADRSFAAAASALMRSEHGLVWNVTPYAFVARDVILWEPEAPFDRVPYQLFADGVRVLGITSGLDQGEFQTLLGLLTLDRATEVAPEDDFATLLWDAGFEHVVYQVVDTFADGDQENRLKFERDRDQIVDVAQFDTNEDLADCWKERQPLRAAGPELARRQKKFLTLLAAGPADAEARARAAEVQVAGKADDGPVDASVLHVDDALRTMLSARLSMETAGLSERFAVAVARAFEDGLRQGDAGAVTTPLRSAIDGLAKNTPSLALDMVGSLCREVGSLDSAQEAERQRALVAGAIVSPKMLESVLSGATAPGTNRELYAEGLRMILGYCDATYFDVVLGQLVKMEDAALRDVLIDYSSRHGSGHEAEIGKLFATADIELGLALVRLLAAVKTTAAREAIAHAVQSKHPVVRIEALGHVEGVSSERLRLELRTLLEDRESGVRVAALRAMEQYNIRVAGPFLVLRVRGPGFDDLGLDERRQAFQTLSVLAPTRAESVALEVVNERRLVSSAPHEESRELAVDVLGRLGTTAETKSALTELSTARLRNSERVRVAAGKALEAFNARTAKGAKP
jgi:hypothetical protein